MKMKEALQLRGELLNQVLGADEAGFDVARLHALDEWSVMAGIPHGLDHGTAINAADLGHIEREMAALGVGEEAHLEDVAAAVEESGAGAGEVARISAHGSSHALVHGVLDQVAAITETQAARKAACTAIPRGGNGKCLVVDRGSQGIGVERAGAAVLVDPALPTLMAGERLVSVDVERRLHGERLGQRIGEVLGKERSGRQEQKKQRGTEAGSHFSIFTQACVEEAPMRKYS